MTDVAHDEELREFLDIEQRRMRLDKYVCAVASGWYAVSDSRPQVGLHDHPENPRADVTLTAACIVEAALQLMSEADSSIEAGEDLPSDDGEEEEDDGDAT